MLVALLWPVALAGEQRAVGAGMVAAGLTDALDGYVARRKGKETRHGAWLDAIADTTLMVSAALWLGMFHPEIAPDAAPVVVATAVLYAAGAATSVIVYRRLVDPRQWTAKVAGGLLYVFALFTLLTGSYVALLLDLALFALAASSVEAIFRATRTIHVTVSASKTRSHAPHALKVVGSKAAPATMTPNSAAPTTSEGRP